MAKISNLVIPAVIDTSGIDRGISNIKNKLSQVRGSGGGTIGGGGTGFSSGVTPFGGSGSVAFGGGGGGAFGAAFGAAAGARLLARNSWGGFAGMSKVQADSLKSNNFVSRILTNRANAAFAERRSYFRGKGSGGLGPEYMGPIMPPQMFRTEDQIAQLDRVKNLASIQNANRRGLMYTALATRVGAGVSRFKGSLGMGLGNMRLPPALMGAGAAYAAYNLLDPKQQKARFSNTMDFAGTSNYQSMVALRRQAFAPENQKMSFFQAIDVGAQKGTSNGGTSTLRNIGNFIGSAVEQTGEALGAGTAGPFAMWGRAMGGQGGKTAAQHQEAAEFVVGSLMLQVENTFKRLFN